MRPASGTELVKFRRENSFAVAAVAHTFVHDQSRHDIACGTLEISNGLSGLAVEWGIAPDSLVEGAAIYSSVAQFSGWTILAHKITTSFSDRGVEIESREWF